MSAPLEDLRAKISIRAHCALAAHARAHGIDKSELVRNIIDEWALKQMHGASMIPAHLYGLPPAVIRMKGRRQLEEERLIVRDAVAQMKSNLAALDSLTRDLRVMAGDDLPRITQ